MDLDLTNRATLMRSLPHGGEVVEVGVERGVFSRVILKENGPRKLYLVDYWQSRPGTKWDEVDPCAQGNLEHNYQHVLHVFSGDQRVKVLRCLSLEAARMFAEETLDIVYLDADHTAVADDIREWWPLLKPGGWLCGHDYTMYDYITVQRDVDEWIREAGLQLHVTQEGWPSWAVQKWPTAPRTLANDTERV